MNGGRLLFLPAIGRGNSGAFRDVKQPAHDRLLMADWVKDLLFAGTSAFLLLVIKILPGYWYISFFALVPFLYRIIEATPARAMRLGFFLGICFIPVYFADALIISPIIGIIRMMGATALFALFGWVVGLSRQRWGFNPLVVAFIWVGFELASVELGFASCPLGAAGFTLPFSSGIAVLISLLAVSFFVVLANSLILILIKYFAKKLLSNDNPLPENTYKFNFPRKEFIYSKCWYNFLIPRAPPVKAALKT